MEWRHRNVVFLLAALVVTGPSAAASSDDRHEHSGREHVTVRVSRTELDPGIRLATTRDAIVWLNYARIPVRIRLEPDASTRVRCREPSHFRLAVEGYLVASPVEPLEAASLCLLEPGTYDYVVEQLDTAARPPRPVPGGREMRGQIVVSKAAAPTGRDLRRLVDHHRRIAGMEREISRARSQFADLLEANGDLRGASDARRRARAAEVAAARHATEANALEQDLEAR